MTTKFTDPSQWLVSAPGERSCRNASEWTHVHLIKLSMEIPEKGSVTPCKMNCSNWGLQRIRQERGLCCARLALFCQHRKGPASTGQCVLSCQVHSHQASSRRHGRLPVCHSSPSLGNGIGAAMTVIGVVSHVHGVDAMKGIHPQVHHQSIRTITGVRCLRVYI